MPPVLRPFRGPCIAPSPAVDNSTMPYLLRYQAAFVAGSSRAQELWPREAVAYAPPAALLPLAVLLKACMVPYVALEPSCL